MFSYVKKLLASLNSNSHPGDVAHAVSCALLLAFVPKSNLLWPFLFLVTIFMRMNKGAFFLSFLLFSLIVPFADVLTERLGYAILQTDFLYPVFTAMYNVPFVGLTRFNNTMVAGSLAIGAALYVPTYIAMRTFITSWRSRIQPVIVKSKIYKALCQIPLVKLVLKAGDITGGQK